MALRETLELDLSQAQNAIDDLERSIDRLTTSRVEIPVDVETRGLDIADRESTELRQELNRVEDAAEQVADQGDRIGREYKQAGRTAKGGLDKMGAALKTVAGLAVVGFATDRIVNFGKTAVEAASDMAESTSKAEVVFGRFSEQIFDFTVDAPAKLGLSTRAALEMTGTFGNLFVALGLTEQAAAELAPDIVQLGSDLASFNNIEVEDALEKLRAGLVGEAEPLRVLGVNLNEATVKAKAFELGLGDATGQLSEAEKVQARYALILEQTGTAQGDFARTAEGLANSQRTLAAEWENFVADIGEQLIPVLLDVIPILENLIETMGPKLVQGITTSLKWILAIAGIFDEDARNAANLLGVTQQLNEEWLDQESNTRKLYVGLLELNRVGSLNETNFEGLADALGATTTETLKAAEAMRDYLIAEGIPTEGIDQWIAGLREELTKQTAAHQDAALAARAHALAEDRLIQSTEPAVEVTEEMVAALADIKKQAEEAAAAFRDELVGDMEGFVTFFEGVPDELEISIDEMQKNYEDHLKVVDRFWGSLATLAAAGYDDLVGELRKQGPEVVGAAETLAGDLERAGELEGLIESGKASIGRYASEITNALGVEKAAFAAAFFEAGEAMAASLEAALTGQDRIAAWQELGFTIADAIKYGILTNKAPILLGGTVGAELRGTGGSTSSRPPGQNYGGTTVNVNVQGGYQDPVGDGQKAGQAAAAVGARLSGTGGIQE